MSETRAIEANGVLHRVRLDEADGSPAVVFSNSLGTDLTTWDAVVARLPRDFRVVRYDTRGHGLSALPPGPWRIEDCADDLAGILDALGIEGATVVGLSVGGLIAQALAARRPDLASRLVLMDTAARIGTDDLWNTRIETVESKGIEAIADGVIERWFGPRYRAEAAELGLWRAMLTRTPAAGYARLSAAIRDADLTESTRGLRLPVLAMAGSEDGATPPDLVEATAALVEGARFERLDGAGHLPCIDAPDTTARLIADFAAGG
ncbi:MAG: 3-oxoadipate enol-lactonase [Paracoccaceae bacterium]